MKNIQVINSAINCSYDVFAITNSEFHLLFHGGIDTLFLSDLYKRFKGIEQSSLLGQILYRMQFRRLRKSEINSIHGTLFENYDSITAIKNEVSDRLYLERYNRNRICIPRLEKNIELSEIKNIQVIDGAKNCCYDVFSVTLREFNFIFGENSDIAFDDEILDRNKKKNLRNQLKKIYSDMWKRYVPKTEIINGIHGTLFYQMKHKKQYYPTRLDSQAINPDGSALRMFGATGVKLTADFVYDLIDFDEDSQTMTEKKLTKLWDKVYEKIEESFGTSTLEIINKYDKR